VYLSTGVLLLAESQLLLGVNPLLEHDLAVFAFADVHEAARQSAIT
jgi:hypothetical protein